MRLSVIIVCEGYDDYLALTLPRNVKALPFADFYIVTSGKGFGTRAITKDCGAKLVITKRLHEDGAFFAKGKAINDAIAQIPCPEWILLIDADILLQKDMGFKLRHHAKDKDCLYYTRRWGPEKEIQVTKLLDDYDALNKDTNHLFVMHAFKKEEHTTKRTGNTIECAPLGYFQLFNINAENLDRYATIYIEKHKSAAMDDHIFGNFVYSDDNRRLLPMWDCDVIHLPHGGHAKNWKGRTTKRI